MISRTIYVLFFLFVSHLTQAQLSGDTYAKAKATKSGTLTLTYSHAPGFIVKDASGNPKGLCVDMMEGFAEYVKQKEGITLQLNYSHASSMDFSKFMESVKTSQGGVIGLGDITITAQRKTQYQFSLPFINNISILMSNIEVPTLREMSEIGTSFKGLTCYMVEKTTNAARIERIRDLYFPDMKIVGVSNNMEAMQKVMNDPKGFTALDFTYYLEIRKQGAPVKRHPAADESAEEYGLIMAKGNDWAPLLNQYLATLLPSQQYRSWIAEHIGHNALQMLDSISKKTTGECQCNCTE